MVLNPGQSTGSADNVHAASDQWLYVVAGTGEAIIEGKSVTLAKGDLLLIEAGEKHEIHNTGEKKLETFNIYAPPEY